MSKVTIRGSGPETELLLDGVRVRKLVSFHLIGDGADSATTLVLKIEVDDAEIETDVEVVRT